MSGPTYRMKTGRILTDADVEALADEAERGYDVAHLVGKPVDESRLEALRALGRDATGRSAQSNPTTSI